MGHTNHVGTVFANSAKRYYSRWHRPGDWVVAGENLLLNTNLVTGWSKSYNQDIQWNYVAPPDGIAVDGSRNVIGPTTNVVGFTDCQEKPCGGGQANDGNGYWYSY